MPRILPITLIAVLMVLPLKLGTVVDGLPAIAQQFDREFGGHDRPWADDLTAPPAATPPVPAAAPEPAPQVTSAPAPAAPPVALAAPSCTDPALRDAIREQLADTAARTGRLRETEAVLTATEARVTAQIRRLNAVRGEVEALMERRSALQEEDLRRTVAIYEAMKPRDAARILDSLDTAEVVDVLDRLAERRAAPILAAMSDGKAREVTRAILQRRALPGDRTPAAPAPRTTLTN
ncbi:MotE family protein [Azospirillum halopraeferens]|uniref:MotE family protein n=1 Tax=Azospirillum halopraeferens TaxID=34010 RepID=UPI00041BD48E|nr:flagellar motor switch protein [Azospirillum halopraeferens]